MTLVTYSLKREAKAWWKTYRETIEDEYEGDAREQFRHANLDKYFSFTTREDKAREFDLLVQADQYEAKFSDLSKYDPEKVNTPAKRSRNFERGLLPRIHSQVAGFMLITYEDLYRWVPNAEKILRECDEHEALKEKRPSEGTSIGFTKDAKRGRFIRRGAATNVSR